MSRQLLVILFFQIVSVCFAIAPGDFAFWRPPIVSLTGINLVISANTNNYDIFTAAGSPATAVAVTLTVNAGVTVGSTSITAAAIDTGTFPVGTTITIINNGTIIGKGGNGGNGVAAATTGNPGGSGGPALILHNPVTITNNGSIWAGGGGGGAGGG